MRPEHKAGAAVATATAALGLFPATLSQLLEAIRVDQHLYTLLAWICAMIVTLGVAAVSGTLIDHWTAEAHRRRRTEQPQQSDIYKGDGT